MSFKADATYGHPERKYYEYNIRNDIYDILKYVQCEEEHIQFRFRMILRHLNAKIVPFFFF